MNHRETQKGPQEGVNRDFGARSYENMPSVTDRRWEGSGRDDSFGPAGLGGYGDFAAPGDTEHLAGARAIGRLTERALARGRGRGPKNATRSDSLIAEELSERFMHDDLLDASEILIRVEFGRVLLTGEVPERWMKHRAEDIADSVRGVQDIDNKIRIDDGTKSFGAGGAVRAGLSQQGSGFSSTPPNDREARDDRAE